VFVNLSALNSTHGRMRLQLRLRPQLASSRFAVGFRSRTPSRASGSDGEPPLLYGGQLGRLSMPSGLTASGLDVRQPSTLGPETGPSGELAPMSAVSPCPR